MLVPPETMCGELSIPVAVLLRGPTSPPATRLRQPAAQLNFAGRRCLLLASSVGTIREKKLQAYRMLKVLKHLLHSSDTTAVLDYLKHCSQAAVLHSVAGSKHE